MVNIDIEAGFLSRLRTRMEETGVRQIELATAAGISRGAVSKILNAKARPAQGTLTAFAQALNCNPVWLATGEGTVELPLKHDVLTADEAELLELWRGLPAGGRETLHALVAYLHDVSGEAVAMKEGLKRLLKSKV